MFLTYKEASTMHGGRYGLNKAVRQGELRHVGRNLYATDDNGDELLSLMKLYPDAIVTGQTALYLHGLIDLPPELIDLASKRGGTKMSSGSVRQTFIPGEWLALGKTTIIHDGEEIRAYDLERMLLELMRSRHKIPYDIYREAVNSYRKLDGELDIYKLEDYARDMPRGESYFDRALKEVF